MANRQLQNIEHIPILVLRQPITPLQASMTTSQASTKFTNILHVTLTFLLMRNNTQGWKIYEKIC